MIELLFRPLCTLGTIALLSAGSMHAAPPPAGKSGEQPPAAAGPSTKGGDAVKGASTPSLKSGEQVYKETCSTCHAAGVANAPKFGDKAAWKKLLSENQDSLTADGWLGLRAMPPKGGRDDLKLEEFARAVAFMARAAGGNWKDPDAKLMALIAEAEKKARAKRSQAK